MKFTHEQIVTRYQKFVEEFLEGEESVVRVELLPNLWSVSVPEKNFKVLIECKCLSHFHGIEQWFAVVKEPDGSYSNFLLFEDEIDEWAAKQKKLKGIE